MIEKALAIEGWMNEAELQWLAEQAKHHSVIVEIGSFLGRSTRALADNTPGKVYAVDHWYGPMEVNMAPWEREELYERFLANMNGLIESSKVIPLRCNSQTVIVPELADMVFIDGDHSYESVWHDLQKWRHTPFLCGHDFSWKEVRNALSDFFNEDQIEQVEGTDIWFRK